MMENNLTILSTNGYAKNTAPLDLIAASVCTAVCIAVLSGNGAQANFSQSLLPNVCMTSTDTARWNVYNNGNITFYWDGVAVVDPALQLSYERISEIRNLQDNWNEEGASKFSNQILDTIQGIVENLSRQPQIFPTARDSIQLEYENDRRDYLEFELFESGRLKKFFYGCDGQTETKDIPIASIREEVDRFYDK